MTRRPEPSCAKALAILAAAALSAIVAAVAPARADPSRRPRSGRAAWSRGDALRVDRARAEDPHAAVRDHLRRAEPQAAGALRGEDPGGDSARTEPAHVGGNRFGGGRGAGARGAGARGDVLPIDTGRNDGARSEGSRHDGARVDPLGGAEARREPPAGSQSAEAARAAEATAPSARAATPIPPAPGVPLAGGSAGDALTPGTLGRALARYADEPTVEDVVRAALAASGLDPGRARAAATRARASAWLPTARVGVRRGSGVDLSLRQTAAVADRSVLSADESLALEGALVFQLGRAVFAREEVPLLREERAIAEERRELIVDVVRVYHERRRLQLERDLLGRDDLEHALAIAERTAVLDGWTRGAFSRGLQAAAHRRGLAPWGDPHVPPR
jgi:hypothetical protein